MNVRMTAPRSSLFESRPTLKSDSLPERMAMMWLIWERVREQRERHPQERTHEHHQDLGGVAGKEILDELADVVVDDPTLLDGSHDGREVVVSQHHVGRFLRDVGARYAHRHSYLGLSQGRGVVYAVAGHGNDVVLVLQGFDYIEPVLRRDPRVDGHLLDEVLQPPFAYASEVPSRQDAPCFAFGPVIGDAELARDGPSGQRVVARHHYGSDTRSLAGFHGIFGLGSGRVDHADHAEEGQIALELFIERLQASDTHPQNADAALRQVLVGGRDPLPPSFVQGLGLPVVSPDFV